MKKGNQLRIYSLLSALSACSPSVQQRKTAAIAEQGCPESPQAVYAGAFGADEEPDCARLLETAKQHVVRLDQFLVAQLCQGVQKNPAEIVTELRAQKRIFLLPIAVAEALKATPPRGIRREDIYVVATEAQDQMRQQIGWRPFLGSGGKLAILTATVGIKGHWEVTADAVQQLRSEHEEGFEKFTDDAVAVLQDAAQDPDFWEWNNPSAHGQTGNDDKTGRALPWEWRKLWAKWMREHLERSIAAAQAGRTLDALYLLGYSLHAVEDLGSHLGRTNSEHSYNHSFEDSSPDENEGSIRHATLLAYLTLRKVRPMYGPSWAKLENFHGARLHKSQKDTLLGHGCDFGLPAYLIYHRQATLFGKLDPCTRKAERIRWCQPEQCAGLLDLIWEEPLSQPQHPISQVH